MILARCVDWTQDAARCLAIRQRVFIEEQGIDPDIEMDTRDASAVHALVSLGAEDVATGRLLPDAHIGRVAVLPEYRGRGLGALVMRVLCQAARERGDAAVYLAAQESAVGFYRRLGFSPHGALYLTAGIPHLDMSFCLETSPWPF